MGNQQHDQGQRNIGEGTKQGDKPMPERQMPQHEQEDKEKKQPGQGGGKQQQQWENTNKDREQQGGQR